MYHSIAVKAESAPGSRRYLICDSLYTEDSANRIRPNTRQSAAGKKKIQNSRSFFFLLFDYRIVFFSRLDDDEVGIYFLSQFCFFRGKKK
jgi:hypothetical protein